MTATIKPLPCPVCGREPTVVPYSLYPGEWAARCGEVLRKKDHSITADGKGESGAIKNWNRYVGRTK